MNLRPFLFVSVALSGLLFSLAGHAAEAGIRVDGEASKTAPHAAALQWRAAGFPSAAAARQRYQALPLEKLLELERYNERRQMKAMKIGIARNAAGESAGEALPPLRWIKTGNGGSVTRLVFSSPDAMALRVGLQVIDLPAQAELRFAGSLGGSPVVAMTTGREIAGLLDDKRVFWTPGTDGESQTVEIYLPRGADRRQVTLRAPQLSHLLANSLDDFKIMKDIGSSGACNIDAACKVAELGADYVGAKNAVAHMVFVSGGSSYVCTGTLLGDTDASSQVPFFYSANHCIENQAVASTLSTYWGRETAACGGGGVIGTQLIGGATYLYSSAVTDALLLRLNRPAPAGAYFAGWDSSVLPTGSTVVAVHHPKGDSKKVSIGQQLERDASEITVGWLQGTTEGGSSGSAIFSQDYNGYHLRGGLYGGSASCANTGSLANTQNRDYYSRFDVVFPDISMHLAAVTASPIHANGSQPMVRPGALPVPPPARSAPRPVGSPSAGPARPGQPEPFER
jgi:hypothetical protein